MAQSQLQSVKQAVPKVRKFVSGSPAQQREMLPKGMQQAGAGAMHGVSELGNEMATPQGLAGMVAITALTGLPPGPVLSLIKAGLSYAAISQLMDTAPEAMDAFQRGDIEEGTRLATHAAAQTGMAVGTPLIKGRMPANPEAAAQAGGLSRALGKMGGEEGTLRLDFFKGGSPAASAKVQGRELVPGSKKGSITPEGIVPGAEKAVLTVEQLPLTLQKKSELGKALDLLENSGVNVDQPGTIILRDVTTGVDKELSFAEAQEMYNFPARTATGPRTASGVRSFAGPQYRNAPTPQEQFVAHARSGQKSLTTGRPKKPVKPEEAQPLVQTPASVAQPAPAGEFDIFSHVSQLPGLTQKQRLALIQSYITATEEAAVAAPKIVNPAPTTTPIVEPPAPTKAPKVVEPTPEIPSVTPEPTNAASTLAALDPADKTIFEAGVKALLDEGDAAVLTELQSIISGKHPNPNEFIAKAMEAGKRPPVVEGVAPVEPPPEYAGEKSEVSAFWRKGVGKKRETPKLGTTIKVPTTPQELDAFLKARSQPGSKLDDLQMVGYGTVVAKVPGTNLYSIVSNTGKEVLAMLMTFCGAPLPAKAA
jgi:hypothetical protein